MFRLMLAVACAFFCIGQARADDQLRFGAQSDWIVPVAAPAAKPADGAATVRLFDFQTRFDDRGVHQYARQIVRINTPEGLMAGGTIALAWQPALGGATVNRVTIHRGTETIDVLKDGKGFQILRREAGLEALTITGILTAVMQVPDLRVGDELEFAYTIDGANPILAGHAEALVPLTKLPPMDRLAVRFSWPLERKVNWKAGPLAPKSVLSKAGAWQVLTLNQDGWVTPEVPAGAPGRFGYGGLIQIADFADWGTVAGVMRPLFAKSSTIAPDSPIMAEVKRIAVLSVDPKVRATEALRVVQSQVRYLARVDGLGGYTPEPADAVWSGKSGDCKGKTVLLLAMLRALGITAEPALVSATDGDGVDTSLPMPGRFNHVVVRATIGGKTYWLDGTRLGDRAVDSIAVPGFKWALPLDAGVAATAPVGLIALAATEPALPDTEFALELDARDGLTKSAKATGSVTYRGETGSAMRLLQSATPTAQFDDYMRKSWSARYSWIEVKTVSVSTDKDSGDVVLSFTGTAKMTWDGSGLDAVRRYQTDYSQLGRDLTPKRDKDGDAAPVAIAGDYTLTREVILLPGNGKGFELEGENFDRVIGGVRYVRTSTLAGGRFEMSAASRNKPFELSFAEAKIADKQTDAMYNKLLFIRAPADFAGGPPTAETRVAGTDTPLDSGNAEITRLTLANKFDAALKLVDTRIAAGEKTARTLAMRGQLLARLGRDKEAGNAYDQALAIDRREATAIMGKAGLLTRANKLDDALALFDRLITLYPDSTEPYRMRGELRALMGDRDGALSDIDIFIGKMPDNQWAYSTRVELLLEQGKSAEALATANALLKLKPDDEIAHALVGYVYAMQGKRAEAVAEYAKSIAIKPTTDAYDGRVRFELASDDKGRLADMLALIKLDAESDVPAVPLRKLLINAAARTAIVGAYDTALAADPDNNDIQLKRDLMLAIGGDPKSYLARIDAALAEKPGDATRLNEACWTRAMFRLDLEAAIAQCTKSIALDPDPNTLDSRGLVWLQRGEWAKAASDYDAAIVVRPRMASSLYGRGLARKRLGDAAGSTADFAAAARIDRWIGETYAGYGLKP